MSPTKNLNSRIKDLAKDSKINCCCKYYGMFTCWDKNYCFCVGFLVLLICFLVYSAICISIFSVSLAAIKEAEEFDETIVSPLEPIVELFEPKSLQPCFYPSTEKHYIGYYACNFTLSPVTQYCPIGYKCKDSPLSDSNYYPCIKKGSDCTDCCIKAIRNIPFVENFTMKGITFSTPTWVVIFEGCVILVMSIIFLIGFVLAGKGKILFVVFLILSLFGYALYFILMMVGFISFDGGVYYERYAYCFDGPGTEYLDKIDSYSDALLGLFIGLVIMTTISWLIIGICFLVMIAMTDSGYSGSGGSSSSSGFLGAMSFGSFGGGLGGFGGFGGGGFGGDFGGGC